MKKRVKTIMATEGEGWDRHVSTRVGHAPVRIDPPFAAPLPSGGQLVADLANLAMMAIGWPNR